MSTPHRTLPHAFLAFVHQLALIQVALLALSLDAFAADPVDECIARHVDGQLFRNQGRLEAAQIQFAECSSDACPVLVRKECVALLREVEAALPSVVLSAIDESGAPTSAVVVRVDGSSEFVPLTDRPLPLDPGEHELHFRHAGGSALNVRVSLVEFEHDRKVEADFRIPAGTEGNALTRGEAPPVDMSMTSSNDGSRPLVLVSGGTAVAALGAFTYFALSGNAVEKKLDRCKPNCDDRSDLDRLHTRYLIADVSLGVALVSLGVGAYLWLTSPSAAASLAAQYPTPNHLRWQPVASGRSLELRALGDF